MVKQSSKILAGAIAGTLVISSLVAFATPTANNFIGNKNRSGFMQNGQAGKQMRPNQEQMKTEMQATLTSLVTDGILTQEKADALLAFLSTKPTTKPEMGKMQGPFARAVEAGIITQAECDAINAKMQADAQIKMQAQMDSSLQAIVDSGKITAEQKASIIAALNDGQTAKKAEMDKVKAMTEEERTAYFKDNNNVFVSPIDKLIENKVITAEQAAYVKRATGRMHGGNFGMMDQKGKQFGGKQGQRQHGAMPSQSAAPAPATTVQ